MKGEWDKLWSLCSLGLCWSSSSECKTLLARRTARAPLSRRARRVLASSTVRSRTPASRAIAAARTAAGELVSLIQKARGDVELGRCEVSTRYAASLRVNRGGDTIIRPRHKNANTTTWLVSHRTVIKFHAELSSRTSFTKNWRSMTNFIGTRDNNIVKH